MSYNQPLLLKVYNKHQTSGGRPTLSGSPFLLMDTTQEPMDTVKSWQDWYRKHQVVASMEEPMASKDSRENLHDTSVELWRVQESEE